METARTISKNFTGFYKNISDAVEKIRIAKETHLVQMNKKIEILEKRSETLSFEEIED